MNQRNLTPAEASLLAHLRGTSIGWWGAFWPVLKSANPETLERLALAFPEEVKVLKRYREDPAYGRNLLL